MTQIPSLMPCPFCGTALEMRGGRNPYGRCNTDGCWMNARSYVVSMDDPNQVAAWNTRATEIERLSSIRDRLLVELYLRDRPGTARLCDGELDRSGALLGRIRDLASLKQESGRG